MKYVTMRIRHHGKTSSIRLEYSLLDTLAMALDAKPYSEVKKSINKVVRIYAEQYFYDKNRTARVRDAILGTIKIALEDRKRAEQE